jgi:hypothetical protein
MDTDVIALKSFDDLRANHSISLGFQTEKNFCNAVIVTQKGSKFLSEWYEGYKSVDFDKCWDCHSIVFPSQLKEKMLNEVNVLPKGSFYDPSFYHEEARLRPPYDGKYGQH